MNNKYRSIVFWVAFAGYLSGVTYLLSTHLVHAEDNAKPDSVKTQVAKLDSLTAGIKFVTDKTQIVIWVKQSRINEIDTQIAKLEKERNDLQKEVNLLTNLNTYIGTLKDGDR